MTHSIIRVENLSKKYVISHQRESSSVHQYRALRDVISDKVRSLGRNLVKSGKNKLPDPTCEEFWALRDVSFDIQQGEAIGIIGRNGAGKSTLLKILSRITEPTAGRIVVQGRVASLLEVGTGFHPELTGRENIYLNGSILGMARSEIQKKFDEIVAFAEVEKFLDTPVKRYSSGMYVRLAFAVAAHLEPEILVVDEVLAVGDSAFQKKCLGKMGDVATKEGRTVLFVSHSMQAVSQLTKRCILLSKGNVQFDGNTNRAINLYLASPKDSAEQPAYYRAPANKTGNYLAWAKVHTSEAEGIHCWGNSITFEFALHITQPDANLLFTFQVVSAFQQQICNFWFSEPDAPFCRAPGTFILRCEIPKFRLYMGLYTLKAWICNPRDQTVLEKLMDICPFEITMHNFERPEYQWGADECTYLEDAVWQIAETCSENSDSISVIAS